MSFTDRITSGNVRNKILASLPLEALRQLRPKVSAVSLNLRQTLHQHGLPVKTVYFVERGWASATISFVDGFQVGTALIGSEGVTGLCLLSGSTREITDAVVQAAGEAFAMDAGEFKDALETIPGFRQALQRYSEAFRAQAMQTAACNAHHSLEQRLARWLLMMDDRNDSENLAVTQELLATMLSVHRPSITIAIGRLQRAQLIRYTIQQVAILDRPSLRKVACECYERGRIGFAAGLP